MRLWILLSRFEKGGLERVQANLAPTFVEHGLEVTIAAGIFTNGTKATLPSSLQINEIGNSGKILFIFNLFRALRNSKPDAIITTSNDLACLVLLARKFLYPKTAVICTQHLAIDAQLKISKGINRLKHQLIIYLMQKTWPKADAIIAVSSGLSEDIRRTIKLKSSIETIPNPVVMPNFNNKIHQRIHWPWPDTLMPTFIFVGRLAQVKRLDLLLNSFIAVYKAMPCRLIILGDGPDKRYVNDFININNLHAVCHLAGHQDNPLPWIARSDTLVLSSDYEGFGNVLVEAMACGTQVISTNCQYGPAEILDNGRYGQLIPTNDMTSLIHAMFRALSKEFFVDPVTLAKRADDFNLRKASEAYLNVIFKAVRKS